MEGAKEILDWLRAGRDDANDIVDLPWDVKQLEPNLFMASHPRMPFNLLVAFDEGFVHLLVPLGLETFSMAKDDKLKVYHALLRLNGEVNMMKFTLMGMNDDVYLAVDLDLKSLSKEEFNDALTALLFGLLTAVSALGLEEDFQRALQERVLAMVYERLQRGASRKQLLEFLTVRVGMNQRDAESLLDQVLKDDSDVAYM
jgi:hypothetical protein